MLDKRPGYYQGNDGLPTKKPRISHYKKAETNSGSSNLGDNGRTAGSGGGGSNSGGGVSAISGGAGGSSANNGSGGTSGGGVIDGWDQRQHQRDRRGDCRPERTTNSDVLLRSYGKPCLTPTSDSEEPISQLVGHRDGGITGMSSSSVAATSNALAASHNSHGSVTHGSSSSVNRHHYIAKTAMPGAAVDCVARSIPGVVSDGSGAGGYSSGSSNGILADRRDRGERNDRGRVGDRDHDSRNGTADSSYNNMTAPDYAATDDNTVSTSSCGLDLPESPKSSEYPDYLT